MEKLNYLKTNYNEKKESTPYDYRLVNHIKSLSGINLKGNILDLACGTGSFKAVFDDFGAKYHGVDIDNDDSNKNIIRSDISTVNLPYPDDFFDVIFFKMGIEHLTIKEISFCLENAKRCLKVGGTLIVITPDWAWNYKIFYNEYTHQTPFMKKSLETALKMSGFSLDYCETFIQLPFIWRVPYLKVVCDLISPCYPFLKNIKFVKFSQERALLAIASR